MKTTRSAPLFRPPVTAASPRRAKKDPLNPRSFLWQVILSCLAHGSMPSWALPYETIAASILLQDRDGDRHGGSDDNESEKERL